MSYYFEGTKDFLVTTPALLVTFTAEAAITAGNPVILNTTGKVNVVTTVGPLNFIGVAYESVASGSQCGVIVWGFAKNLTALATITPGQFLLATGSGFITTGSITGSLVGAAVGKAYGLSGSTGTFQGFIGIFTA